MLPKVLVTFISKFLAAVFSFLIVIITSKLIGAEGRGEISLFVLGITLSLLLNNIIGGSALVLLASDKKPLQLLIPSYLWAIVSSILIPITLLATTNISYHLLYHIFFISLIQSLGSVNLNLFLGLKKYYLFNIINLLQVLVLFTVISVFMFLLDMRTVSDYITAMYISFILQTLSTYWFLIKFINLEFTLEFRSTIRSILNLGVIIQVCNIVQLLNYRFAYFILEKELGIGILGVFATATALAESVWLISKSISMIQYAEIAGSKDKTIARRSTIRFAKLSLAASTIIYIPLLFIPENIFAFIFGVEFKEIGTQVILFSPGILAFSFSTILAHYFAGFGRNSINLLISSVGLLMTIVLSVVLIPSMGINGAAISVSSSYIGTTILYLVIFKQDVGLKLRELIPKVSDFQLFAYELKKITKK